MESFQEIKQKKQYVIKVKTMDNNLYDFEFDPELPVHELKLLISQKIRVPYNRQRLIYQGKMLLNQDTMKDLKIKSNQVLHLVALPPNLNQQIEESLSATSNYDRNFQYANMIGGIMRSMHQSANQAKQRNQYRRKQGIKLNQKDRFEIIQQNLKVINQLFENRVSSQDLIQNQNLNVFSMKNRQFYEGQWVDIKDLQDQWQEAQIVHVLENQALVQLLVGRKTELIDLDSKRIAFFRSHTIDTSINQFYSPSSQLINKSKGNSLDEIIESLQKQLDLLQTTLQQLKQHKQQANQMEQQAQKSGEQIDNNKSQNTQKVNENSMHELINKEQILVLSETKSLQENFDTNSIQSVKSKEDQDLDQKDNCSIKSFRSYVSFSNWSHHLKQNTIDEYIMEENEYLDSENSSLNQSLDYQELDFYRQAAQIAPILDRLGRTMIDLAPVLAQFGCNLQKLLQNNQQQSQNTSLYTNEGSAYQQEQQFYFQVPLLPNPQEQVQISEQQAQNQNNNIDIHIHTFMNNSMSNISLVNQQNLNISNQSQEKTQDKATQTHLIKKVSFLQTDKDQEDNKQSFIDQRSAQQKEYNQLLNIMQQNDDMESNIAQDKRKKNEQLIVIRDESNFDNSSGNQNN